MIIKHEVKRAQRGLFRGLGRLGRMGRLGLTSTVVNGGITYGSGLTRIGPARPVGIGPVIGPKKTTTTSAPTTSSSGLPGGLPPSWYSNAGTPYAGWDNTLAQLYQIYLTNPSSLNSTQIGRLTAAGVGSGGIQQGGGYGSGGWGGGGGYGSSGGYGGGGSSYQNPNNPNSSANLAQLELLYQSNPSQLTQQQWQQLQAAGVIPATDPYSNASLTSGSSSAIDPATGVPYATELAEESAASTTAQPATLGTDLSATYYGLPLWGWLAIGGGVLYLVSSSGKRR